MAKIEGKGFAADFLDNYLAFGLGSMSKSDIDTLIVALLEHYGLPSGQPIRTANNQEVSTLLRAPVAKVKKLRYEAALKYGENINNEAKARLLLALNQSSMERDGDKLCIIIEDTLARTWLQGQLKENRTLFDHSFNSEIIKLPSSDFFALLENVYGPTHIEDFRKSYIQAKQTLDANTRNKIFKEATFEFIKGAISATGSLAANKALAIILGVT